ncbi:MAG: glycosyltransferase [candidate division WOR-3 bacterium]|nr:MAG: glycosyltransferase [candidate division WOR-3 bacterium]
MNRGQERSAMRIVVSGIGTGGHYFPAVITANELQKRKCDVVFLVRKGYQEEFIAKKYGLRTFNIRSRAFYGKSHIGKLLFILTLFHSILRLHSLVRNAIGIAFGGFGAVALNISCIMHRRAFYIFEPNRVPGRATRFFATAARRVFLGMPPAHALNGNLLVTGIPIRPEFKRMVRPSVRKMSKGTSHILFYGGSQGATRLNDLALEIAKTMPRQWRLTIITGSRDQKRVSSQGRTNTKVIPFTESPWREISEADIVVSRAGALAAYEIVACHRKVIFVPFPFAVDRHQYHNASYFAEIGDAGVCEERDITAARLLAIIREMLKKRKVRKTRLIMDAEQRIADCVMGDVNEKK